MVADRIQKVLANAGLASRRGVERWIEEGHISVNGKPATLGQKIGPKDRVLVHGKPFVWRDSQSELVTIAYHKPIGQVCTRSDPEDRPTVFQALPKRKFGRWISIGRLDVNTAGLLLFTTDGELANRLMHPSNQVQREYAVRALGTMSDADITSLKRGIELEDGIAKVHGIRAMERKEGANQWYRVVLTEGKKREVRRLFEAVGLTVNRLIRVRFGDIELHRQHRIEQVRTLSPGEQRSLYRAAGLDAPGGLQQQRERKDQSTRKTRSHKGKKRTRR